MEDAEERHPLPQKLTKKDEENLEARKCETVKMTAEMTKEDIEKPVSDNSFTKESQPEEMQEKTADVETDHMETEENEVKTSTPEETPYIRCSIRYHNISDEIKERQGNTKETDKPSEEEAKGEMRVYGRVGTERELDVMENIVEEKMEDQAKQLAEETTNNDRKTDYNNTDETLEVKVYKLVEDKREEESNTEMETTDKVETKEEKPVESGETEKPQQFK